MLQNGQVTLHLHTATHYSYTEYYKMLGFKIDSEFYSCSFTQWPNEVERAVSFLFDQAKAGWKRPGWPETPTTTSRNISPKVIVLCQRKRSPVSSAFAKYTTNAPGYFLDSNGKMATSNESPPSLPPPIVFTSPSLPLFPNQYN